MKVSIVMPIYNVEKYISQSIESILNQEHKSFELIVINDGSTDETENIVKTYLSDDRIKYYNIGRLGKIKAFNLGYKYVTSQPSYNGKWKAMIPGGKGMGGKLLMSGALLGGGMLVGNAMAGGDESDDTDVDLDTMQFGGQFNGGGLVNNYNQFIRNYNGGGLIQGFKEGLKLLKIGDKATLFLPYYLAYGETESRGIPAKSNLIFEVEIVDQK